jgi:hypothetical protein
MLVHLRRLVAGLLVAGATVTPAACARDDSSIFIFGSLVVNRTDCTWMAASNPMIWLAGQIDAAYAGEYTAVLQVENQIVARGNVNTLKTETSGVQLYDAEVQVLDPVTNNALSQFSVPVSGFVPPGTSGSPGLGAAEVVMVDATTLRGLGQKVVGSKTVQQVVSSVIIRGRTLGGLEVHTQEFLFPINVYYGSTCFQPSGMSCTGATSSSSMNGVCLLGIDEPSNCQQIYSALGACHALECPQLPGGQSDLLNAHCPAHPQPDDSCCNP